MLEDLEVVAVDCQTTGTSPGSCHLVEVAWARGRARDPRWPLEVHRVRLPEGAAVPRRVAALTGLRTADLAGALPRDEVLRLVPRDRPVVAHFARFEAAFLGAFPELICTHEIALRLLPGLPRRSLRALAGYLGHVLPEAKRAAPHVEATVSVWRALAPRLAERGVASLPDLRAFLATTPAARRGGRAYALPRERRLALPDGPGVYRLRGPRGDVLYLGKATSLKRRVNSYFQKVRHLKGRIPELLTQTFEVDVAETASPLEAALLEADEIKAWAPPYNVALKERDEGLWFASRDLGSLRTGPDDRHGTGPLPDRRVVEGVRGQTGWRRTGARLRRDPPEEMDAAQLAARNAAHLVRRAGWLLRLSESALCWKPPGRGRRVLVLERGRVVRAEDGDRAPVPPGWRRTRAERQRAFDRATYDRLRVLTTELKRIVAGRGYVELCLGPGVRRGRPSLARRLYWL